MIYLGCRATKERAPIYWLTAGTGLGQSWEPGIPFRPPMEEAEAPSVEPLLLSPKSALTRSWSQEQKLGTELRYSDYGMQAS